MRKLAAAAGLILLMAFTAAAQDTSKLQGDGGFLYAPTLNQGPTGNCLGAYGQATYFLIGGLGATVNLGGCSHTFLPPRHGASTFEYVFGPTYAWRSHRLIEPFVQVLAGGARLSMTQPSGTVNVNGFALNAGGGIDLRANYRVSFRLIEASWVLTHTAGATQNSLELKVGVTFRYGGHN